jgi:hypothetical protein
METMVMVTVIMATATHIAMEVMDIITVGVIITVMTTIVVILMGLVLLMEEVIATEPQIREWEKEEILITISI